jgi:hypothetical protein
MAIDWTNKRREIFRLALQKAYTDYNQLEIFVDEKLDENLSAIVEKAQLSTVIFNLLKWARSPKGSGLDELFKQFCEANPKIKDSVIAELQRQPLISSAVKMTEQDWETLFEQFSPYDFADIQRAFLRGFRRAINVEFMTARPDPPLTEQAQIQALLTTHDNPILAVRFVECAIAELQRSSEGNERDLTALQQWRDRIAQQFSIPPFLAPEPQTHCHAYLLVALEEIGSDVNVYPELHITGKENPIQFGAKPTTCPVDQVAAQISDWIRLAEQALDDTCDDEEVVLEVFLPCRHLEADIANTWYVKNKRGDEICLGTHRRFLVRSFDRIRDRQIQKALKRKWQELETCDSAQNACDKFHPVENCPQHKGDLLALLKDKDAPGLKLIAPLPSDPVQRTYLLYDIIDAAIPIALWSSEVAEANILQIEFDDLLSQSNLTNFAELARKWREQRRKSTGAKQIRLLCDRPDRWPKLPDPNREEDLLVAS